MIYILYLIVYLLIIQLFLILKISITKKNTDRRDKTISYLQFRSVESRIKRGGRSPNKSYDRYNTTYHQGSEIRVKQFFVTICLFCFNRFLTALKNCVKHVY